MKASELRIGNIVYDSLRNNDVQIKLKHFNELNIAESNFFDRYKPIPLTEDWLLKFGLELKNNFENIKEFKKNKIKVIKRLKENILILFYERTDILEIKSVHQLQNIYFALTGEELELKTI